VKDRKLFRDNGCTTGNSKNVEEFDENEKRVDLGFKATAFIYYKER